MEAKPQIQDKKDKDFEGEYLTILEQAGTSGRYQWLVFILSLATYYAVGFAMAAVIYSTMSNQFDCSSIDPTWSTQQCERYVCDHVPPEDIENFPVIQKYETFGTEFGPFYCGENVMLGVYRGVGFLGAFMGALSLTIFSDNFSRKKTWAGAILVWIVCLVFLLLLKDLYLTVICIFSMGFVSSPLIRLTQIFISEVTEPKLKQKLISSVLAFFTIGNFLVSVAFDSIQNWRRAIVICLLPPLIITVLLLIFLVVDTPKFILRDKNAKKAAEHFNWVAKLNGREQTYREEELQELMQTQKEYGKIKGLFTPLDLFRYKSLRKTSILVVIVWFTGDFIFLGPLGIINNIGVNNQFNALSFTLGELFAIPLIVLLISQFQRKKLSIVALSIAAVITIGISFIPVPAICDFCRQGVLQMVLTGITRTCIYFHFATLHNMQVEFYPVSIRNIGLGAPYSITNLAGVFSQLAFMDAHQRGVNPFHIILGGILVTILIMFFLPETFHMKDRNHIEEIVEEKHSYSKIKGYQETNKTV